VKIPHIKVAILGLVALGCSAGGGSDPFSNANGSGGGSPSGIGGSPWMPGQSGNPGLGGGVLNVAGTSSGGALTTLDGSVPTPTGPVFIDECATNPLGLDAAAVQKLQAGSGGPGSLRILNPYDGTVFPRGLIAPLLMWDGATADTVYLHIHSSNVDYKGCFAPTGTNQLQIPQPAWDAIAENTRGPSDPYTLELTVSSGGTATGPVSERLVVAQATLKGSIFYNTYKSLLVKPTDIIGVVTGGQGAVLRIVPGQPAAPFLGQTACTGCHSVSANGTRMVANPNPVITTSGGATYSIGVGNVTNPPPLVPNAPSGSFAGVSPDGSLYVSNAHPGGMGPRAGGPGSGGDLDAHLYETSTGALVANSGVPTGAMTPMFSPDGALLTFNDYAIASGHGLAVMNFDVTTRTASNYRQVFQVTDMLTYPGWPFFLPDNKALVFAIGTANDFSGMATGLLGPIVAAASDLFILDVATGASAILAQAMGFRTTQDAVSGQTYLPFGAEELHHNFYPTVSPVAAGGYFWVFFDSYRRYGNKHGGIPVRQLWGAAVDISSNGVYGGDPSHPAFYLTGQEDVLGNHRAFAALDPCRRDGDACTTGIDCCGGFCTNNVCKVPPPPPVGPPCARTDESCANGVACCNATDQCIGGFCGLILH
jgi:hypothetical protein